MYGTMPVNIGGKRGVKHLECAVKAQSEYVADLCADLHHETVFEMEKEDNADGVVDKLDLLRNALSRGKKRNASEMAFSSRAPRLVSGSGPSGFYTAKYLLDNKVTNTGLKVDIIDRLPTPFGLVRYGVAPDHPEVKSVNDQFAEVAKSDHFRYFGNIEVGKDVTLTDLRARYDGVILAYGAEGHRSLNIPGENLANVFSARTFVNWYNGHPEFTEVGDQLHLDKVKSVVIIGQGNVALDCARVLAKSSTELASTDITSQAVEVLQSSSVKEIHIVGRRGHAQIAGTIKEIRELTKIDDVNVHIDQTEIDCGTNPATTQEISEKRPLKRLTQLLQQIATDSSSRQLQNSSKRLIRLRFLLSPVRIDSANGSTSSCVVFEKCKLVGEAHQQKAHGTGEFESIPADLVLTSVGYRTIPLKDSSLQLHPVTHTVPNVKGRVLKHNVDTESLLEDSPVEKGVYVTGWCKRGPTGIIGTNITDAKETVACVLDDIVGTEPVNCEDPGEFLLKCKSIKKDGEDDVVTWSDYLNLDREEVSRGQKCDPPKPREKITSIEEMVEIAHNKSSQ